MSDASGNLRVVFDTNVLVSAAISHRGLPRRVLEAWEHGSFQLLMADETLAEVTDVSPRDPKDDPLLAVALSGRADYLITGDDDLLVLDGEPALETLRIVTVRDFLQLLAQQRGEPV